jgi:hypothetical protein
MITEKDRTILKEVGRQYLLDIALDSKLLKEKLTFKEHIKICDMVANLTYEEVISLTITESVRDFENKFPRFLKYSIAAIAGAKWMKGIVKGPATAMFVLYIFRKLTDTCNLVCIKKFPLSSEKKICKAECRVMGAKKIVDDLRREIVKCSQFEYADKCEKKLQVEFIKWSKRLQQLLVQLNQAKLKRNFQDRKTSKKTRLQASYEIPKAQLIKIISESSKLREKINFRDHIKLYNSVLKEDDYIVKPPKVNPKIEKYVRQGLFVGLFAVPIPLFSITVTNIVKNYNFSCVSKCTAQQKFPKSLCFHQCSYLTAKFTVALLEKNLKTCNKAEKPYKCKKNIYKMLEDWKQREVAAKIKFENELKKELRVAKTKNSRASERT